MATKKKKPTRVLICPKCGSTDVLPHPKDHVVPRTSVFAAMYISHVCNKCKHVGRFFPEIPVKNIAAYRKKLKKKRK